MILNQKYIVYMKNVQRRFLNKKLKKKINM